jgi:hypothetical protein
MRRRFIAIISFLISVMLIVSWADITFFIGYMFVRFMKANVINAQTYDPIIRVTGAVALALLVEICVIIMVLRLWALFERVRGALLDRATVTSVLPKTACLDIDSDLAPVQKVDTDQ